MHTYADMPLWLLFQGQAVRPQSVFGMVEVSLGWIGIGQVNKRSGRAAFMFQKQMFAE